MSSKNLNRSFDNYDHYGNVIQSKYLKSSKKLYNLAGIDSNVEQLRQEQLHELTKLLISLKSEYDVLIRETLRKKKDTEEIAKQIEVLEKIERKVVEKQNNLEVNLVEMKKQIEVKKHRLEEELFERDSLINHEEKMKTDIIHLQKKLNMGEIALKKNHKELEKQKFKSTEIKERLNQIHQRIDEQRKKNLHNRGEHELVSQYYNQVIENKWNFIKSGEERKEKQKKIAQDAKNDTQDKIEVEKRKQYFLIMLFNKYLKRKVIKETIDNKILEKTFQEIKKVTGVSNIKQVVDRVYTKDKDYNLCVAKVNSRENQIKSLKQRIESLENNFKELKSSASIDPQEQNKTAKKTNYDQYAEDLQKEEDRLKDELEEMREKNRNVELIYEKVIENMRAITHRKEDDANNSQDASKSTRSSNIEDDLIYDFKEYVNRMNNVANETYSKMTKSEFENLMRAQSRDMSDQKEEKKNEVRTSTRKGTKKSSDRESAKRVIKHLDSYPYEEDEEDQKINEEFKGVIRSQQRAAAMEKLRQERERELEKKNVANK